MEVLFLTIQYNHHTWEATQQVLFTTHFLPEISNISNPVLMLRIKHQWVFLVLKVTDTWLCCCMDSPGCPPLLLCCTKIHTLSYGPKTAAPSIIKHYYSRVEGSALLLEYQSRASQVFLSSNAGSNCAKNCPGKRPKLVSTRKKGAKHGHQSSAQLASGTPSAVIMLQAQHSTNELLRASETKENYKN